MSTPDKDSAERAILARLETLEARVNRLEETRDRLTAGLELDERDPQSAEDVNCIAQSVDAGKEADQLEFEVGQVWFSKVGIVALTFGVVFALSLPYPGLPAFVPSLLGLLLVAVILWVVHRWGQAIGSLAGFIRAGGFLLFFLSVLRLFYFGREAALVPESLAGIAVLVLATTACFVGALGYRSPYLAIIALFAGFVTSLIVPFPWFTLIMLLILGAMAAFLRVRHEWPWVLTAGVILGYSTFLIAMLNRPVLGNPIKWVIEPSVSPAFALLLLVIFGVGSLLRRDNSVEGPPTAINTLLNGGLGFSAFLLATEAAAARAETGGFFAVATVVFLAIATGFWIGEKSRLATFVYSMTGYLALSVAIAKFAGVPNVFVWLSLQSLLVVATAVWFQSRFIVAANFLIYLATIVGYLSLAGAGSGISFVFGAVALGSARILAWKKDRLQLRTELMRNGYLACGFVAFPFAAYHLVPNQFVSISWVGIAGLYYLMNLAVNSRKYRWMGHGTLLLAVLYLTVVGIAQLKPEYRILSFVVLGVALVAVSLVFSFIRNRRGRDDTGGGDDGCH